MWSAASSSNCPVGSNLNVLSGMCIEQSGSGIATWYSTALQCIKQKMRLPTYGELEFMRQNAVALGLNFNQAGGMYWTGDQAGANSSLVVNMASGNTTNYTASNASAAAWCVK